MKIFHFLSFLCFFSIQIGLHAQNTVGTTYYDSETTDGYILFAPMGRSDSYLIDNCGRVINSWNGSNFPGLYNYLHTDGQLYRATRENNAFIPMAGLGGRFERIDWNNNINWSYKFSSNTYTPHHDFVVLPNGNIVFIYLEVKSLTEAYVAGRDSSLLNDNELWVEALMEIEPLGVDSARVVWEWHLWDHIVQEINPLLTNYGIVAQHPELVDINYTFGNNGADWLHANSVSYNATYDQLAISVRNTNEIWVIDHSTTTSEAAGHTGGNAGKGGDLLYRWGNPSAYQAVGDTIFDQQHDVSWVGDSSLMVYNNGPSRGYASVDLIHPPLSPTGAYTNPTAAGQAFAPANLHWSYAISPLNSSSRLSSAERLDNGHTLICNGRTGHIVELNPQNTVIWEYINPATGSGITAQGSLVGTNNQLFKARRYLATDSRFNGLDMTPGDPIELNFNLDLCLSAHETNQQFANSLLLSPNPIQDYCYLQSDQALGLIQIFHSNGQLFQSFQCSTTSLQLNSSNWPKGMYFIKTEKSTPVKVLKF